MVMTMFAFANRDVSDGSSRLAFRAAVGP